MPMNDSHTLACKSYLEDTYENVGGHLGPIPRDANMGDRSGPSTLF